MAFYTSSRHATIAFTMSWVMLRTMVLSGDVLHRYEVDAMPLLMS
ncbi:MAG: hypothetical protein ACXWHG_15350 [Thermoanaerobaculia bacterium]